ncbi:MAG: hypothetical protein D6718_04085 [Acidobacteria bacterium]|nr:MAG: hypothetical protein D6718_04085 [Acidobacteriota bacterium]
MDGEFRSAFYPGVRRAFRPRPAWQRSLRGAPVPSERSCGIRAPAVPERPCLPGAASGNRVAEADVPYPPDVRSAFHRLLVPPQLRLLRLRP